MFHVKLYSSGILPVNSVSKLKIRFFCFLYFLVIFFFYLILCVVQTSKHLFHVPKTIFNGLFHFFHFFAAYSFS